MTKLDVGYGPLIELLIPGRTYFVPDYQRAYTWQASKQVTELWNDIVRLYRSRIVEDMEVDGHFIGSIVVGKASTRALGPVEAPIIDGQQRIITLSLILCAIRDAIVPESEDKDEITQQYLARIKNGDIHELRIKPGEKDLQVYHALIDNVTPANRKSLIYRNYMHILQQIEAGPDFEVDPDEPEIETPSVSENSEVEIDISYYKSESRAGWNWRLLIEVIGRNLEIVSIADVPPENAYSIFASLNSTGLPLAQVDLVRNAIFMLLPENGPRVNAKYWKPLEQNLGSDLLQSYLHAWVMQNGYNVPVKDVYRSVVQLISPPGRGEVWIEQNIKDLYMGAWAYLLVVDPRSEERRNDFDPDAKAVPKKIVEQLCRLRDWGTSPLEPTLLELTKSWRMGEISAERLLEGLDALESFVVRRFISRIPPNDLRSTFARITAILSKTKRSDQVDSLITALREVNRRWPTDTEISRALISEPFYREQGQRQAFYVLKRIAEYLEDKECPHIQLGTGASDFSIEHLLPQNLNEKWRSDLVSWDEPDALITHGELLHTIGNLTLTAYNSELSDHEFEVKKKFIGENSTLKLSGGFLKANRWSSLEIRSRSEFLADLVLSIWKR